ncbi:hypothetical protein V7457_28485 [Bacillus toyonensis]|uniref:hypothetical protein n=1 Tax=Bacillus toyonensis TaxID=155322 RepID=UPI003000C58F
MANRRLELYHKTDVVTYIGHDLKCHYWSEVIQIVRNEYLDIELTAQENEAVISTGFDTHPLQKCI